MDNFNNEDNNQNSENNVIETTAVFESETAQNDAISYHEKSGENESTTTNGTTYTNSTNSEETGLSIASMICGIGSLVSICINPVLYVALAIVAIVLGVLGKKKGGEKYAKAGIICGSVALGIGVLLIIIAIAGFGALLVGISAIPKV